MDRCWESVLKPLLAAEGVTFLRFEDLAPDEKRRMSDYFEEAIFPVLTPLVVDPSHPFPFISSGSLSLILSVRHPVTGTDRFARIKVPENRPRFVEAGPQRFVLVEDVIGAHLHMLFPGMEIVDQDCMRVIRNAEMGTPGEEADDLLEVIENELKRRRLAESVTLEMQGDVHPARWELLLEELALTDRDVYRTESPLDLADLFQIASISLPNHFDPPFTPAVPSLFSNVTDAVTLFTALRERDVLVHHPYESFDATVARFVDEAADDPTVLAIKQTMYRTSPDSPILASLIDAAGRGKQVAVLVELTARFDEANNIEWARRLESAGVHVAYGNPDQKIHSKICLVVARGGRRDDVRSHRHGELQLSAPHASTRTSGCSPPIRASAPTSCASSTTSPGSPTTSRPAIC
jgi:polyphosphate kinase